MFVELGEEEVRLRKEWLGLTAALYVVVPVLLGLIADGSPAAAINAGMVGMGSLLTLGLMYYFVYSRFGTGLLTFIMAGSLVGKLIELNVVMQEGGALLWSMFIIHGLFYAAWFRKSVDVRRLHKRIWKEVREQKEGV